MIHPILAALPDGTNAEEFVQNLGFEAKFQLDGISDLPDGLTLDDWKITTPEGFKLAGKWEADSGSDDYFVACFLKPTTPLATAIWLIGQGQMVQDNAPERLASRFLDTNALLESMRTAADPHTPDEDWPSLHQPESHQLESALKLLIDGWAHQTGNEPTFSINTHS